MTNWYVQRAMQMALTVFVVITLTFVLIRMLPGSAAGVLRARLEEETDMSTAEISATIERFINVNPEDPIHVAYVDFVGSTLRGDLGESVWYNDSVNAILAEAIPWTLFIVSWSLFIGFFLGIALGSAMAYYEGEKIDVGLTTYGMIAGSVPYYVFAVVLLLVFSYRTGVFPSSGRVGSVEHGFNPEFVASVIHHAALPTISMVLSGSIASLSMRANSISVLGEDYLRVARLRGLPNNTIIGQYVLRNAVLPMYTSFMVSVGQVFGGVVILESIFGYRGMGWYMVESVSTRDYPLMMGCFMVITIAVVCALFVADITYPRIDPRVTVENKEL